MSKTPEELIKKVVDAILEYDPEKTTEAVKEALNAGVPPLEIMEKGVTQALKEVGKMFSEGKIFLPELIMVGEAGKAALNILEPKIKERKETIKSYGKVLLATVEGDIHDIGKSLVGAVLMANGFEVIDIGVDVPTDKLVEKVKELKPDVVGLSALMTTTMLNQEKVIKKLKEAGLRNTVKVIVGGAPVTEEWAKKIGADAYGADAMDTVKKIKKLLGVKE
ncbi:MAG: cobalamin B12-binding domain-containing protein [Candidatus Baldrarchaeia archaeon]